jgi:hypothetical protein
VVVQGQPCNAGEHLEWEGTNWQCRVVNDYRGTHFEANEEFISVATASDWFTSTNSGTGAAVSVETSGWGGTSARLGLGTIATGTTTTGSASRRTAQTLYPGDWTKTEYDATWAPSALSNGTDTYLAVSGFYNADVSATQAAGCFVAYDEGNVLAGGLNGSNTNSPEFVSAASSTRTRVLLNGTSQDGTTGGAGSIATCSLTLAAGSAPDTNFHTFQIIETPSSCQLLVDGSLCVTLTTNVPASGQALFAGTFDVKSAGTTSRIVIIDRHDLAINIPLARSL